MHLKRMIGIADYYSRRKGVFYPWGFAMNSMTSRLEATRQLIYGLQIEQIIETGTFRGTTTEWFAQFGIPVETVEINERFFAFSQVRLAGFRNVTVSLSSSVPFLQAREATSASTLFYLDSHWENHLPLREELELIFARYPNSVVLIDDFKVPDDEGYGFDHYAADKELTIEYVRASNVPALFYFFPSTPSMQETGAKRGWVVLTANAEMAHQLRTLPLVREHRLRSEATQLPQ
jgi:hypothetical protein